MKNLFYFILLITLMISCDQKKSSKSAALSQTNSVKQQSDYKGTASVTQGVTESHVKNIFVCSGGRITNTGVIEDEDGKQWVVPASNHFTDDKFPFAPDLYNSCNGNNYAHVQEALSNLDGSDILEIDKGGELITAYIFADNYFEMYVNGVPVGKDRIPFTPFNSSLVRFQVTRPFTIAMKLIDWEEDLGIGTEKNRSSDFHAGDGGMVAVFMNSEDQIIAITDEKWKAQTFYTSPVKNLNCVKESGNLRISENCDASDSDDGSAFYGLHWELPEGWKKSNFDDSTWPNASTFTNKIIGVDNKKAYTNFADIFDHQANDAKFIWSSNVVLDNEVVVRYTVN